MKNTFIQQYVTYGCDREGFFSLLWFFLFVYRFDIKIYMERVPSFYAVCKHKQGISIVFAELIHFYGVMLTLCGSFKNPVMRQVLMKLLYYLQMSRNVCRKKPSLIGSTPTYRK